MKTENSKEKTEGSYVTAYDFSDSGYSPITGIRFGISSANVAAELRRLADLIDRHKLVLQAVKELSVAKCDDYVMTHLRLTFHQKNPVVKELRGADSKFPEDAAAVDASAS